MEKGGKCGTTQKRGLDSSCFIGASEFLLTNTLGGPTADLAQNNAGIPHPGGPDGVELIQALAQFVRNARAIFDRLAGGHVDASQLELMVFWVVFILSTGNVLGIDNVIPAKNINAKCKPGTEKCTNESCKGKDSLCTKGEQAGCLCEEPECPPEDRTPNCINCGGNDGSNKCLGVSTCPSQISDNMTYAVS